MKNVTKDQLESIIKNASEIIDAYKRYQDPHGYVYASYAMNIRNSVESILNQLHYENNENN